MVRLDVYVRRGCDNCDFARRLAAETAQAFPALRVRVLELDSVLQPPEVVFATPTYLLNGTVISLGNPGREELHALIARALETDRAVSE